MTDKLNLLEDSTPMEDEKTSDQILKEIEAKRRELKKEPSITLGSPVEPPSPNGSDQVDQKPEDKSVEGDAGATEPDSSGSKDVSAPEVSQESKDKAAFESMQKKKGFKTLTDFFKSYEHMEREYHRKNQMAKKEEAQPPQWIPPYPAHPGYTPMAPSYPIDEIAKRYGMTPDDLERVAILSKDIAESTMRNELKAIKDKNDELARRLQRREELERLEKDSAFHNPEIREEMEKVLEGDPSIFGRSPEPMTYAFEQALRNIGRRLVEGSQDNLKAQEEGSGYALPTKPPPAGKGSAGAPKGITSKSSKPSLTPEDFKKLSAADMEKVLRRAGAIKDEE